VPSVDQGDSRAGRRHRCISTDAGIVTGRKPLQLGKASLPGDLAPGERPEYLALELPLLRRIRYAFVRDYDFRVVRNAFCFFRRDHGTIVRRAI
jgi:hypothetical protein